MKHASFGTPKKVTKTELRRHAQRKRHDTRHRINPCKKSKPPLTATRFAALSRRTKCEPRNKPKAPMVPHPHATNKTSEPKKGSPWSFPGHFQRPISINQAHIQPSNSRPHAIVHGQGWVIPLGFIANRLGPTCDRFASLPSFQMIGMYVCTGKGELPAYL